ncbi:MAG TPA: DNA mismatch endonuclease Vsr [Clostridiales bacterium]|nr:DNA mismatch endonuclease Vsr [Clostridiales bacterium]
MTDSISKEHRSWNMSRIRSRDTKPELLVRSYLHKKGFRFSLNGKVSKKTYYKGVLPGKPDIVLPKYKMVIFVHGCFWHRHIGCSRCTFPKSNTEYWLNKFNDTISRDKDNTERLSNTDWNVITLWECELKKNVYEKTMQNLINEIECIKNNSRVL